MERFKSLLKRLAYPLHLLDNGRVFFDTTGALKRNIILVLYVEGEAPDSPSGVALLLEKWFREKHSRWSVAQALRQLEQKGLVERREGSISLTWAGVAVAARHAALARIPFVTGIAVVIAALLGLGLLPGSAGLVAAVLGLLYGAGFAYTVLLSPSTVLPARGLPRRFLGIVRAVPVSLPYIALLSSTPRTGA